MGFNPWVRKIPWRRARQLTPGFSPGESHGAWWTTIQEVTTNPDSVLKSRDITLPKNVYIGKAMIFPVAMYGCESWAIKKAEHQRIDVFKLRC